MSLATTCPNCSTCFRVVQDQLRVSEGWVRCGHCQQVFNALESLFDLDAPQEPMALPPDPSAPGHGVWQTEATARWMRRRDRSSWDADDTTASDETPGEREEPLSDSVRAALHAEPISVLPGDEAVANMPSPDDGDPPAEPEAPEPSVAGVPAPSPADDDAQAAPADGDDPGETAFAPYPVTEQRLEPVFEPPGGSPPDTGPAPTDVDTESAAPAEQDEAPQALPVAPATNDASPVDETPVLLESVWPSPDPVALGAAPADTPQTAVLPSFVAAADRKARWERPAARGAFAALALLMALALAAQATWHWRDWLAASWPATRPVLQALCETAGCTLAAPRRLDALVIDNTTLTRPPGAAGYRLTVHLHNRADHPVAVPSFDLVLTDAQGEVLSRRVVRAEDFDYREPALPALAEAQWTLEFTLGEGTLVGYTLAAFYP